MDSSLYVGLSRQMVLQRAMDMSANNVANVSTPGYRSQNPMFKEYISNPQGAAQPLSLVYDEGQYNTTAPGPATYTGSTYDVALTGPGFFSAKTVTGQTEYTRAGNFTVDAKGMLVTANGMQVEGKGGSPIIIPEHTKQVSVTPEGDVQADGTTIGSFNVTEFSNVQDLKPGGNGMYVTKNQGTPATTTTVKQGMLEGSNVNSVTEMSRMIEISRQYEQMMSMMKNENDRQTGAIQALAKVNG